MEHDLCGDGKKFLPRLFSKGGGGTPPCFAEKLVFQQFSSPTEGAKSVQRRGRSYLSNLAAYDKITSLPNPSAEGKCYIKWKT